jgi:hypothetical protein
LLNVIKRKEAAISLISISQRLFLKKRCKVEFFLSFNVNFFEFLTTNNPYLLSIFDCVETSFEGGKLKTKTQQPISYLKVPVHLINKEKI